MAAQLRGRPEVHVVADGDIDSAEVAVVVVEEIDEAAARTVRAVRRDGCPRVVLVASNLDDAALMAAVEVGACAVLRRREASPERLAAAARPPPAATARWRPTCSAACWSRWAGCSARSSRPAASVPPG